MLLAFVVAPGFLSEMHGVGPGVVPEPGTTGVFLLTALFGMAAMSWKKRR